MNILFVCTGNTCRSPMAEAILKGKQIDNINVRSAGIYAIPYAEMSAYTKLVLDEANIMHQHQATQLSSAEIEWADLILTMTTSHRESIIANFPSEEQKVFTLKEYTSTTELQDVVDPYGGTKIMYEQTFQELNELIDRLVKKIEGN
ncbi:protein tyrosine phosphatase [Lysinibacillus contaminans]|uniref:Protein tyrosine phosphatase n=1 Tax=Lysinibacillus contaminans TaxID=1293441 RepID=A0ABR5JX87_9BACI|nr:low molecular weight protein arginine phosphatase [Lysinibacillus contaminans]KOS66565.1 protein tyrosine phosphatase [Lysinibacillus contaminans]